MKKNVILNFAIIFSILLSCESSFAQEKNADSIKYLNNDLEFIYEQGMNIESIDKNAFAPRLLFVPESLLPEFNSLYSSYNFISLSIVTIPDSAVEMFKRRQEIAKPEVIEKQ